MPVCFEMTVDLYVTTQRRFRLEVQADEQRDGSAPSSDLSDVRMTDQIVPHDASALHDETNVLQYGDVCNRIALDCDHVSQFSRVQ